MASILPVGAFRHGGRLLEATAAYPDAPQPWLDLSTGINPEPWPGARASAEALRRLPDPGDLAKLEASAAQAFGVADPARVVAVPGAEAGLRLLPRLLGEGHVALAAPIYGGHAEAWTARTPHLVTSLSDASAERAAVVVLVNPNNPDGRRIDRSDLSAFVSRRSKAGRWTIVDESFVEVAPELSLADLDIERLVVLRSFGKFYGLPGARLGFVVAGHALAGELRSLLGDWPVSADALVMGATAYADETWRETTRSWLSDQALAIDRVLRDVGLEPVGGCDLFRWVAAPDAHALFSDLCQLGVLTRPFADRPDRLRIGLPSRNDFNRFAEVIRAVRS